MINNKQQTAVEWLIEKHFGGIENCTPDFRHKIEQAKEIDKQRIAKAFTDGKAQNFSFYDKTGEQYYNENYG
jgi:hypothetical protein